MTGGHPAFRFQKIKGELVLPGDKSLAHRYLFLAPFAVKPVKLSNLPGGLDVRSSIECLKKIGVRITGAPPEITIYPFSGFEKKVISPQIELDCGNSGTTARFLFGFLSALGIGARISGDESLNRRPMKRVAEPLSEMGCRIYLSDGGTLPAVVEPAARLKGIDWTMKAPSAQVKTAVLLAGLKAEGATMIHEKLATRDHTEIMLTEAGADISLNLGEIRLHPLIKPLDLPEMIRIPGDISTAAFFITVAVLLGGSELTLNHALLNTHRAYYLDVLKKMGASIAIKQEYNCFGERAGDLIIEYNGGLRGIEMSGEETVKCIDEIPVLAVAASFAKGRSVFRDLEELRVKESDRLKAIEFNLQKLGVDAKMSGSSLEIIGRTPAIYLGSGDKERENGPAAEPLVEFDSFGDHRIAMAMKTASLAAHRDCTIKGSGSAAVSAPGFFDDLNRLLVERRPVNIFLAGFMGAGKTSVGELLAKELDYSFINLDEWIEKTAGKPIRRIFEEDSEERFREMEKKELMNLAGIEKTVVALGGGTTCDPENMKHIVNSGLMVLLTAPPELLYERTKNGDNRPLADTKIEFYKFYNSRIEKGCYDTADFIIDTSKNSASAIAKTIRDNIREILSVNNSFWNK